MSEGRPRRRAYAGRMDLWLLLLIMSLATFRLTRLLVADDFPPVLWLRDRVAGGYRSPTRAETYHESFPNDVEYGEHRGVPGLKGLWTRDEDGEVQVFVSHSKWSPQWLADLISCPWCCSGWVALGVTAGVWAVVGLPVPVLVWPAVWAVGALIASQEWA